MFIISILVSIVGALIMCVVAILTFVLLINLPQLFLEKIFNKKKKEKMPEGIQAIYIRDANGKMQESYKKHIL
jgi:hypothetical protein